MSLPPSGRKRKETPLYIPIEQQINRGGVGVGWGIPIQKEVTITKQAKTKSNTPQET